MLLESVLKFIFDSIGSPISTKKISDTPFIGGIGINDNIIAIDFFIVILSFNIIQPKITVMIGHK